MKILIADDDYACRALLAGILSKMPEHQVTIAEDGKTAWEMLDDAGRFFDVAFLDIAMPAPDGLEILKRVADVPHLRSIAVVICTASNDRTTIGKAIAAGARHYVVKPCVEATIVAKLQQIEAIHSLTAKQG